MNSKTISNKKFYFSHAWIVFLVMSIILMLVSLSYIFLGRSIEPQANITIREITNISPILSNFVTQILRVFGLSWLTWGFLSMMISATAYRKGEMWAWYAFWIMPLYEIGDGLIDYMAGGTTWIIPEMIAIFLIIVLLTSPQANFFFKRNKNNIAS